MLFLEKRPSSGKFVALCLVVLVAELIAWQWALAIYDRERTETFIGYICSPIEDNAIANRCRLEDFVYHHQIIRKYRALVFRTCEACATRYYTFVCAHPESPTASGISYENLITGRLLVIDDKMRELLSCRPGGSFGCKVLVYYLTPPEDQGPGSPPRDNEPPQGYKAVKIVILEEK